MGTKSWYVLACILTLAATTHAANKKRPLVLVCYDGGDSARRQSCDYIRDYVNDPKKCEDAEVVEVTPSNPTPGELKEFLEKKKLPANTLTIVLGHEGTKKADPEVHRFSLGNKESVKTSDVLDAIGGKKGALKTPSIWLSVCGAGQACSSDYCVGGTCQKGELTTSLPETKYTDKATMTVIDLFCKKTNFDTAAAKAASLGGDKLGDHFRCQPDALDFDAFSLLTNDTLEKRLEAKKISSRDSLVRILNGAFLEEVMDDYLKTKGKTTKLEYKLDDRFNKAYAERARDAYAAYLAAGGVPDRAKKAKQITDAMDADDGPLLGGYISADDPAFKALWDKVKYEGPKKNGDYSDYRFTFPWKPLKACVRGEGTSSKFSFRPHLANFTFRFYPDVTYEPKPVEQAPQPKTAKEGSGKGKSH